MKTKLDSGRSRASQKARDKRMARATTRPRATRNAPSRIATEPGGVERDLIPARPDTADSRIGYYTYTPSYKRGGKRYLSRRVCDYYDNEERYFFTWSKQPKPAPSGTYDFVNGASDKTEGHSASRTKRPERKIKACQCKKCRAARKRLI